MEINIAKYFEGVGQLLKWQEESEWSEPLCNLWFKNCWKGEACDQSGD